MNPLSGLTPQQLRKAADIQEQILTLQNELDALLGTPSQVAAPQAPAKRKQRQMGAAGRTKIIAAAKKRWAIYRAEKGKPAQLAPKKKKISAAGKAKLSALAKARWAKVKAAGKARL